MKKLEKTFLVENLTQELKSAKSIVLINYTGMSVKIQQAFKKQLKEVGADMLVVKNTLLKIAGENAGIDKQTLADDILSGQTALIIASEDAIAPINVLGKFIKENEVPDFKVGIVEGTFQDKETLIALSNLPGRDALMGQVLGSLMSGVYQLVGTLNSNLQNLYYILDNKSKGGEN